MNKNQSVLTDIPVTSSTIPPTPEPTLISQPATSPISLQKDLHKQNTKLPVLFVVLFLCVAGGIGAYLRFYFPQKNQSIPVQTESPSEEIVSLKTEDQQFSRIVVTKFNLAIPNSWKAQISNQSKSEFSGRFIIPDVNSEMTFVNVQAGPAGDFGRNILVRFDSEETVKLTNDSYIFRIGKEVFLSSQRRVVQAEANKAGVKMLVTLYTDSSEITKYISIIKGIMNATLESAEPSSVGMLVRPVIAAETNTEESLTPMIAGFSKSDFRSISVMEGPYPERIIDSDKPYGQGFARLYTFSVIKGQRLEILAEEDPEVGSFLESELYDVAGNLITKAQTRNKPPEDYIDNYSGPYYLIVNSFGNKTGKFLLKVFDLDQVQDKYYAKYADGSEILLNESGGMVSKNQQAVLLINFVSPIEIIDNNHIRYFRKPDNSCLNCQLIRNPVFFGDITIPLTVSVDNVVVPIKLTKLFLNQVIVQPEEADAFDIGKQVSINIRYDETSGYGLGFGTR